MDTFRTNTKCPSQKVVYLKESQVFLQKRLKTGTLGFVVLRCWTIFLVVFGYFNIELRYCIAVFSKPAGCVFLGILDGIKNYPSFSKPFPVSNHFMSC